jgi:hypothetical protein
MTRCLGGTVFSQHGIFGPLSDDILQKGPAYKLPMETSIGAMSGRVAGRCRDDSGNEKAVTEKPKHRAIDYDVKVKLGV